MAVYLLKFFETNPKITKAIAKMITPSKITIIFASINIARIIQIPIKINIAAFLFIQIKLLRVVQKIE